MLYGTALYCSQKMVPQNRSFRFPVKFWIFHIVIVSSNVSLSQFTPSKNGCNLFRFAIIISSYFITGRHSTSVVYQLPKLRRRVRFPLSALFYFHRNSYFPLRYIDNLIYLPRELLDGSCHPFRDLAEGGQAMVTYSDLFTFVIMLCAIITLVRDNKRKNNRPLPG